MKAEIPPKAPATIFHMKMMIGIKDSENGCILMATKKFECDIPVPEGYCTYQSRLTRAENIALGEFAKQLEKDLESNRVLKKRLSNVEWTLFSKTISVTEK